MARTLKTLPDDIKKAAARDGAMYTLGRTRGVFWGFALAVALRTAFDWSVVSFGLSQ